MTKATNVEKNKLQSYKQLDVLLISRVMVGVVFNLIKKAMNQPITTTTK